MSPEMQAKLDKLKAQQAGGGGGGAATAPETDGAAPDATPATAPAKPARGRPAAKPKAPTGEGLGATMHALADELTAAEAVVADVRRRMAEALA